MSEENRGKIFPKVTAGLCILVALFGIIAFCTSGLLARTRDLNGQIVFKEEQVEQNEAYIVQLQADIADYQQQKQNSEASLLTAEDDLAKAEQAVIDRQNALQQAEDKLDAVCTRTYYSSWYCDSSCKFLHTAVDTCEEELDDAYDEQYSCQSTVEYIKEDISSYTSMISYAESEIQATQERIENLNDEIGELTAKLVGAWILVVFKVLALLLALAGLGVLIVNFFAGPRKLFNLIAMVALALSSFLFLVTGAFHNTAAKFVLPVYLLLSPHTWNLAVMTLFAIMSLGKVKKPVLVRNIAVVLTVILSGLIIVGGSPIVGAPYAAAMICTAFVLVPLEFTEYIDIAKHIFLSLITCGIWLFVWNYHVTKNLNDVESVEDRGPGRELALCMFLPFYYPYWLYKTAEAVEDYGMENGKEFKIDILCIAFSFLCPLYATVWIQNKINVVVGKPVPTEPEVQPAPQPEFKPVEF